MGRCPTRIHHLRSIGSATRVLATHVGGDTNNAVTPRQSVDSYTPIDLSLTWRVGEVMDDPVTEDLTLSFEVRNVFDEDPPYVNIAPSGNGSGGYDATVTNPVGRLFAVSVRKSI